MAEYAIEAEGLTKEFDGLKAVDRLTLRVRPGEVYGFLGPNGAGKTTTIKMLLGLTRPTRGRVRFDGADLAEHGPEIRAHLGFLPEKMAFYPNLTAAQTLAFFAELRGADPAAAAPLLRDVGLAKFADARVGTFSKGMVQLLGVAQALLGSPRVLVLDEPTTGLDPRWTRLVKDKILAAAEGGATIFFSSHLLAEVQELADRVGILSRGRLVAEDTVDALGHKVSPGARLRVRLKGGLEDAARAVMEVEGVTAAEPEGDELVVRCAEGAKAAVIQRLAARGFEVLDFHTEESTLEDVFLKLTEDGKGAVR